jgi:phage I-like protein
MRSAATPPRVPGLPALCAAAAPVTGAVALAFLDEAAREADAPAPFVPPDWIRIAPRGDAATRDGRRFHFDPEALVQTFATEAVDLPIDVGHLTERRDLDYAPGAVGWIRAIEARADGLWARCEWLDEGRWQLRSRRYRYVSPAFLHTDAFVVTRLTSVALVTTPALPGLSAVASLTPNGDTVPMLNALLQALGLPETATEPEALAALAALHARPATAALATGDMVPAAQLAAVSGELANARAELQRRDDEARAARCQALVDQAVKDGKVAPAAAAFYVTLALKDHDACKAALDAMPAVLAAGAAAATSQPLSATLQAGALTAQQTAIAAACGVKPEIFAAA